MDALAPHPGKLHRPCTNAKLRGDQGHLGAMEPEELSTDRLHAKGCNGVHQENSQKFKWVLCSKVKTCHVVPLLRIDKCRRPRHSQSAKIPLQAWLHAACKSINYSCIQTTNSSRHGPLCAGVVLPVQSPASTKVSSVHASRPNSDGPLSVHGSYASGRVYVSCRDTEDRKSKLTYDKYHP